MSEEWCAVVGQNGRYEVSSLGRVRSIDRYIWRRASRRHPEPWQQFNPGKMLSISIGNHGYPQVRMAGKTVLVHQLMLEAFEGPRPDKGESLHDDDCKTNNTFPNLRWGTRSQNVIDAYRNGRRESRKGMPRNKRKEIG